MRSRACGRHRDSWASVSSLPRAGLRKRMGAGTRQRRWPPALRYQFIGVPLYRSIEMAHCHLAARHHDEAGVAIACSGGCGCIVGRAARGNRWRRGDDDDDEGYRGLRSVWNMVRRTPMFRLFDQPYRTKSLWKRAEGSVAAGSVALAVGGGAAWRWRQGRWR